jgi:hypothetical protein
LRRTVDRGVGLHDCSHPRPFRTTMIHRSCFEAFGPLIIRFCDNRELLRRVGQRSSFQDNVMGSDQTAVSLIDLWNRPNRRAPPVGDV